MKVLFKDLALRELYETGTTNDRKYKRICKKINETHYGNKK